MSWKGKRVMVTGAAGFIGSHLTEELLRQGARVRAFIKYHPRQSPQFLADAQKKYAARLELFTGDIRDLDAVQKAVEGAHTVFHLAASISIPYSFERPNEVFQVNALGTAHVLVAAKTHRTRRLIVTSTSEVYGTAQWTPITERHPLNPHSPYAASKVAADAMAISFHRSYGVPVTVLRPFNTFGPRQSLRAIIPTIILQALQSGAVTLGNLRPTRDFTFVADTVNGFLKTAACQAAVGQTLQLGTGREISIADLARKISGALGKKIRIKTEGKRKRSRSSEVDRLLSSCEKIKGMTGWQAEISLEEGLNKTIAWMKRNRHLYPTTEYQI
ncbi:MAG: SDR family NAD(P)-dependent oxidoreductase [Elusimicrobia bacterium]|nr:SDR family NAD(P)-dependent oxidoreductase [Elusimicrobiota bacterium]